MNKNKLILIFSLCIAVVAIISSCAKDEGKIPVVTISACDTITYTKHIKPIIDTSCISCHGTSPLPGAPPMNNYAEVKVVGGNGKFKATVFDAQPELMPQGGNPLPQAKKDLITCWLNNGMKQ